MINAGLLFVLFKFLFEQILYFCNCHFSIIENKLPIPVKAFPGDLPENCIIDTKSKKKVRFKFESEMWDMERNLKITKKNLREKSRECKTDKIILP